jgi:5-hydroxyisourate hydrolase
MSLSTHILDTASGKPAAHVPIVLHEMRGGSWVEIERASTNDDGRHRFAAAIGAGAWRLRFDTAAYFAATGTAGFYPYVEVVFTVTDAAAHHHVPLLIAPYGYSTYRGS